MSFLGGINLGTPAERNEKTFRRDFELRRSRWCPRGAATYVYAGAGDFMLRHGKFYSGRECPDQYKHLMGGEGHCFENAIHGCYADPSLRYCEGFYWTGDAYAMCHAWCVAPDGGMVELTLPSDPETVARMMCGRTRLPFMNPEHWGYWGAIFSVELARDHMDRFGQPMFDRSPAEILNAPDHIDVTQPHDFPILQVPYDPNRRNLP